MRKRLEKKLEDMADGISSENDEKMSEFSESGSISLRTRSQIKSLSTVICNESTPFHKKKNLTVKEKKAKNVKPKKNSEKTLAVDNDINKLVLNSNIISEEVTTIKAVFPDIEFPVDNLIGLKKNVCEITSSEIVLSATPNQDTSIMDFQSHHAIHFTASPIVVEKEELKSNFNNKGKNAFSRKNKINNIASVSSPKIKKKNYKNKNNNNQISTEHNNRKNNNNSIINNKNNFSNHKNIDNDLNNDTQCSTQCSTSNKKNSTPLSPNSRMQIRQSHSHLSNDVNINNNILDLNFSQFGTLIGLATSLQFIPRNYVKKIRLIYINQMLIIKKDVNNIIGWKKLILLPTVLLSSLPVSQRSAELKFRIDCVERDDWSHFDLNYFTRRFSPLKLDLDDDHVINAHGEFTRNQKFAFKQMQMGNLSKAMNVLNRSEVSSSEFNEAMYTNLQSKFPVAGESGLTNEEIEFSNSKFNDSDLSQEDIPIIQISREDIFSIIKTKEKLIKPGIDKLRYEHLCQLMGCNYSLLPAPDALEFGNLLGEILSFLANAQLPDDIIQFFKDQELVGVKKPSNNSLQDYVADYRPLCMGGTLRKIVATAIFRLSKKFNDEHFHRLQYAFDKSGTEKIIHVMRQTLNGYKDTEFDFYKIDGSNAFNSCNRSRLLFEVKKNFPLAFNFIRSMYLSSSNMWIYGFSNHVRNIQSVEGVQQGCPLSSWCYAMVTLPFLKKVAVELNAPLNGIVKGFVDDLTIAGPTENLLRTISYIKQEGSFYGYSINFGKGCYLMAQKNDNETAISHFESLVSLGLKESTIKIHPMNLKIEDGNMVNYSNYGTKLLGTHIGSFDYINDQLSDYLNLLQNLKNNLIAFPHLQSRFLLLSNCFCNKINHICRTTRVDLVLPLLKKFEDMQKEILLSILNKKEISDFQWQQCKFSMTNGGLGLRFTQTQAHAAYVASSIISYDDVLYHFPSVDYNVDNFYSAFVISFEALGHDDLQNPFSLPNIMDLQIKHPNYIQKKLYDSSIKKIYNTFIENISSASKIPTLENLDSPVNEFPDVISSKNIAFNYNNNVYLAWIISLQSPTAGAWLLAVPKFEDFTFSNQEYQTALAVRLHLTINCVTPGLKCNCKSSPFIDSTCHHLITGCKEGRIRQNHHSVLQHSLSKLFRYCGLKVINEEPDCFKTIDPSDNKRPDISILNSNLLGYSQKLILDISVTSPFTGTETGNIQSISLSKARSVERAAKIRFQQKQQKYNNCSALHFLDFLPLVFETSGRLHSDGVLFMKRLAEAGSTLRSIPLDIFINYIYKSFSCLFQKSVAFEINHKLSSLLVSNSELSKYSLIDTCGENIFKNS